ncbi:hypothetical protein E4O86_00915 [Rhizobiales bacterium L72]|uniref:Uncharacterized protein n=1 Tax=Propylenella binzhouense TaxID=2555902 RepID=A0A964T0R3_9HYPH|nr:hypothetical protein [Propylenella binzhouense]
MPRAARPRRRQPGGGRHARRRGRLRACRAHRRRPGARPRSRRRGAGHRVSMRGHARRERLRCCR